MGGWLGMLRIWKSRCFKALNRLHSFKSRAITCCHYLQSTLSTQLYVDNGQSMMCNKDIAKTNNNCGSSDKL